MHARARQRRKESDGHPRAGSQVDGLPRCRVRVSDLRACRQDFKFAAGLDSAARVRLFRVSGTLEINIQKKGAEKEN